MFTRHQKRRRVVLVFPERVTLRGIKREDRWFQLFQNGSLYETPKEKTGVLVFPERVTIEGFFIKKFTITQFRRLKLLLPLFLHDLQIDDALVLVPLRTQLVLIAQHGAKFSRYYWSSAVTPRPRTSWAVLRPRCRGGRLVRGWSLLQGVAASSQTHSTILLCTSYSRFPAQT